MTDIPLVEPLLTCLRLDGRERKLAQLQALTTADWDMVIGQARLQGVSHLLFWQIKDFAGEVGLPQAQLAELRNSFMMSAAKNLLLYRDLAAILEALQPAGIPVILLKGLQLAKFVYPESALRPMVDIDLLLRLDDLPQAVQILLGLGYGASRGFDLRQEARKHQHIPPLYQPGKVPVELHWHIATPGSPLQVDQDGLWERALPVEVAGFPVMVFSPEDLLLHLGLHLLQDEFIGGLKRLYDIAALVTFFGPRLDWAQTQARAIAWGCHKSLFLVLYLASELLNAPVPSQVLEQLRPVDFSAQIEVLARQRVLSVHRSMAELHPDLARLRRRRPFQLKAAALLGALFPYPEYVTAKYALPPGSKKVYFYYLVRLKDLVKRYGWQLWRVLRSDEAVAALAQRENALSDWWMAG